jgi:hypothetical protein
MAFSGEMASAAIDAGAAGALLATPTFSFEVSPPVGDTEFSEPQAVNATMSAE